MDIKNEVIKLLYQNVGKLVSGEFLAVRVGVSRTAVWKAVRKLKDEGYTIVTFKNKGYVLDPTSDRLNADAIADFAPHFEPHVFELVESTNDTAKELAKEAPGKNLVIVANEQSAGRGRRGRAFFSPAETGVYFSAVIYPDISAEKSVLVTTAAALAVAETIEATTGRKALIKWVNDVYVDGRKCVGILTEATLNCETARLDGVVVGIGVNVSTAIFPDEIAHKAGSIGGDASRNELVGRICERLYELTENLETYGIEEYEKRCFVVGKDVCVFERGGGRYDAHALAVDGLGRLVCRKADGSVVALGCEEVSILAK